METITQECKKGGFVKKAFGNIRKKAMPIMLGVGLTIFPLVSNLHSAERNSAETMYFMDATFNQQKMKKIYETGGKEAFLKYYKQHKKNVVGSVSLETGSSEGVILNDMWSGLSKPYSGTAINADLQFGGKIGKFFRGISLYSGRKSVCARKSSYLDITKEETLFLGGQMDVKDYIFRVYSIDVTGNKVNLGIESPNGEDLGSIDVVGAATFLHDNKTFEIIVSELNMGLSAPESSAKVRIAVTVSKYQKETVEVNPTIDDNVREMIVRFGSPAWIEDAQIIVGLGARWISRTEGYTDELTAARVTNEYATTLGVAAIDIFLGESSYKLKLNPENISLYFGLKDYSEEHDYLVFGYDSERIKTQHIAWDQNELSAMLHWVHEIEDDEAGISDWKMAFVLGNHSIANTNSISTPSPGSATIEGPYGSITTKTTDDTLETNRRYYGLDLGMSLKVWKIIFDINYRLNERAEGGEWGATFSGKAHLIFKF